MLYMFKRFWTIFSLGAPVEVTEWIIEVIEATQFEKNKIFSVAKLYRSPTIQRFGSPLSGGR